MYSNNIIFITLFVISYYYVQSVTCIFPIQHSSERPTPTNIPFPTPVLKPTPSPTTTTMTVGNDSATTVSATTPSSSGESLQQHGIVSSITSTNSNVKDEDETIASSCDRTSSNSNTGIKTIYLIRHAESEENRRLGSLKETFQSLSRFNMPKTSDMKAAMELCSIGEQIDSGVSEVGKQQIIQMAHILQQHHFLQTHSIELVAHSPLVRAKMTSLGLLGCIAPTTKVSSVQRVLEVDLLKEKTLTEWLPGQSSSFQQRLLHLENWLNDQVPETNIVLVGHSQFFKALLQLPYKFHNCDVWKVNYNSTATIHSEKWYNLTRLHTILPSSSSSSGCDNENPNERMNDTTTTNHGGVKTEVDKIIPTNDATMNSTKQ
jgi:phosphohistidine phosphatase SixA